jgi:hypothetical protein
MYARITCFGKIKALNLQHSQIKGLDSIFNLNYSTVTDLAKFLGWSTFLSNMTAI